ncbi:hypothetical protein HBA55_13095 [Pseudomaricurvus alkylphenolicus]|uniref:VOC family protein n=1 Tax=Pseudomaricurvus alkylphenolicus TaxID=1306991 RepID=UPI00142455F7|nr:VOC family protein [Pseudomaricurvus alkylphenolicus]NIB40530.1 hypothetical protein [Pseudomaricurvus alkylphenolicus]
MRITQLGYVGFASPNVEQWRSYAAEFLGMEVKETDSGALELRMDERLQRMLIVPAESNGLAFLGFEVDDMAALEAFGAGLSDSGINVHAGDLCECKSRHVRNLIWFLDPDGNRIEIYCNAEQAQQAFLPSRPIGGFRTGELGIGHVALTTRNFKAMGRFYDKVLGLRLSDYVEESPFRASFFHVNPRHHSIAVIENEAQGIHHVMVEYNYLDDVGRLYDMALEKPDCVTVTLGRHSNDHMTSFYSRTPGGFMIETGWAGRLIDDGWEPHSLYGPSIWGHERTWLPPEAREAARLKLKFAADKGILEKTQVNHSDAFDLKYFR